MAATIPSALRDQIGCELYLLSLKGQGQAVMINWVQRRYGLSLSPQAISGILKRERRRVRQEFTATERQEHLLRFIGEQEAVMEDAWRRLGQITGNHTDAPALLANILTASKSVANALGVFVRRAEEDNAAAARQLAAFMKTEIEVTVHDAGVFDRARAETARRQPEEGTRPN